MCYFLARLFIWIEGPTVTLLLGVFNPVAKMSFDLMIRTDLFIYFQQKESVDAQNDIY